MSWAEHGAAFACALLTWWASTAGLIWLDHRARARFAPAMAALTVVAGLSLAGVAASADSATPAAWGGANQVAVWTFGALFALRLSSKLNLYFGVPNFNADMLPDHLAYLKSYVRTGAPTPFYWISITAGLGASLAIALHAARDVATSFEAVGATLVFTLVALGVVEHALMAAPVTDSVLWRWAMANTRPKPVPVSHGR